MHVLVFTYVYKTENNLDIAYLMFVPCIIRRSRNNQLYTQICTAALFYILAPTCFGSSLPSSRSFWIRLSYVKMQIDMVVYHIMWLSGLCAGVAWCRNM
jgi:hypothetical protein